MNRPRARPATRFSAGFMGESTIFKAEVKSDGWAETDLGRLKLGVDVQQGSAMLAIRPEHVGLDGDIPAVVREIVYQGSFKRITAVAKKDAGLTVLLRTAADVPLVVGQEIRLNFPADKLIVLKD